MGKDEVIMIRMTTEQKEKIETEAKKQNINTPEYVRQAIDFYSSLDHHFLRHARADAESFHLPFGVFMMQLITTWQAQDGAKLDVHGKGNLHTYGRAFQFNESGLIKGREHFDLVFEEAKKEEITLRKKIGMTSKAELQGQGVKEEVRVTPTARAKAAKP